MFCIPPLSPSGRALLSGETASCLVPVRPSRARPRMRKYAPYVMQLVCVLCMLFGIFLPCLAINPIISSVPSMHCSCNCTTFNLISFLVGTYRLFPIFATYLSSQHLPSACHVASSAMNILVLISIIYKYAYIKYT